jgi:hypothetical protein
MNLKIYIMRRKNALKEIPIWMLPALESDSIEEGWASISIYIDHKVIFLGLCEMISKRQNRF